MLHDEWRTNVPLEPVNVSLYPCQQCSLEYEGCMTQPERRQMGNHLKSALRPTRGRPMRSAAEEMTTSHLVQEKFKANDHVHVCGCSSPNQVRNRQIRNQSIVETVDDETG